MHEDIFEWFESLEFFGVKLGLHQTQAYFDALGNPEKQLSFIHIAGSNGKGSTAAFLESCLRHAGFKTALYTSPHLAKLNERFIINGQVVSDDVLAQAFRKVKKAADFLRDEKGMMVTYFETTTVTAALLFAEAKVDFVIWETGVGGRLDSTNIISSPLASVITTISLEHQNYLGDTLAKIAFEKAGIIKKNCPVFIGASIGEEAKEVILARAEELDAPAKVLENIPEKTGVEFHKNIPCQVLSNGLKISLAGAHQRSNSALALMVLEELQKKYSFDMEKAKQGFMETVWPARFQYFPEERLLLDGAHNPECAMILAKALDEFFPGEKFDFIYGNFADKDAKEMLEKLVPYAHRFTFIPFGTYRKSATAEELTNLVRLLGFRGECKSSTLENIVEEMKTNTEKWKEGNKKILCGSLHLCGDFLLLRGGDPFAGNLS
ncbi:MAG: bifunctional folylpolyglutamate synthase/dihydrofolate synthase [Lentisphaeria bacterium]|nr:bifunctional folylpolyglutamate synthase/dihydrofolate synthase [Lentisphaeria bacterium]